MKPHLDIGFLYTYVQYNVVFEVKKSTGWSCFMKFPQGAGGYH